MMALVTPERFVAGLRAAGIGHVASVPCSYFGSVLRHLHEEQPLPHLAAANEGSALAFAAGAWLGGTPAAVLAQNSGFGNLINPLTSLLLPYRIPALVFISMRGWPAAEPGEPQHEWMGRLVADWLDSLGIPYWRLAPFLDLSFEAAIAGAAAALKRRQPAFLLIGKDTLTSLGAEAAAGEGGDGRITRDQLVAAVVAERAGAFVIATTGYLSRALYNLDDRPSNFYMQGSMGHALAIALGVAAAQPSRRFVVLDGDGALLMHLGAAAAVGHRAPANLSHIVFDNGGYESTGGQPLGANGIDFAAVASGLGYHRVLGVEDGDRLARALRELLDGPAPAMLVVRGARSRPPKGRASEKIAAADLAMRFAQAMGRVE